MKYYYEIDYEPRGRPNSSRRTCEVPNSQKKMVHVDCLWTYGFSSGMQICAKMFTDTQCGKTRLLLSLEKNFVKPIYIVVIDYVLYLRISWFHEIFAKKVMKVNSRSTLCFKSFWNTLTPIHVPWHPLFYFDTFAWRRSATPHSCIWMSDCLKLF